jgi:hypothetical protein
VRFQITFICFLLVIIVGCSKHFTNQPLPNQPPETFLTVLTDSTLRSTTSQQHLHWWGVDPDGFIKGYYISFDSLHWTFTTSNDSVIGLKLNVNDTTYKFFVAAVDNEGLVDPKPASIRDPIHNSPPVVSFVLQSDVPDTTYPVATFQWIGTDVDGNETIVNYYYAIDDTSQPARWKTVASTSNYVTVDSSDGLTEGTHVFYLKARDVAGAYSKIIRMPIDTTKTWYVKKPKGDFLIIDDYGLTDPADVFYSQILDTLMNGRLKAKDVWDIKTGYSGSSKGTYVPALINPTFIKTLRLFKYIFWYADNDPQLGIAQVALPDFEMNGGKVLFASGFPDGSLDLTGIGDFAPVNNVESNRFALKLFPADSIIAVDPSYPNLFRDYGSILPFPRGLLPKVNARIIYQMGPSSRWTHDSTMIIMGVKDADKASFVLVSAILHRFGGLPPGVPNNVPAILRRVFQGEFGVQ